MPFATKDALANAALNLLGEPDATPFTGGTTVRDTTINRHYDSALETVLTHHRWDFATKLFALDMLSSQPTVHPALFPKAYELPDDLLRIHHIELDNGILINQFQILGTSLFLDGTDLEGHIQYTSNDIAVTAMPTLFADCLVLELAVRCAPMLTQNPSLQEQIKAHHREAFSRATTTETRQTQSNENSSPLAIARTCGTYLARFSTDH